MAATIDILSWNVNGLRAVGKRGFLQTLEASGADVVAIQEVRARPEQVEETLRAPPGWHVALHAAERPGYSGVGVYARQPWQQLETSLGAPELDCEGRVQMVRFGALLLVNVYVPNGSGKDRSNDRVPYKLAFSRRLFDVLAPEVAAGRPVLVVGDWNTAPREIDLARPHDNIGTSGFLPEERAEMERWFAAGWVDTFRAHQPDKRDAYTWWSQRFGVRARNVGWRIDLALASPAAFAAVRRAWISPDTEGSDHCPIGVQMDRSIIER